MMLDDNINGCVGYGGRTAYSRDDVLRLAKSPASTAELPNMIQCAVRGFKLEKIPDFNASARLVERAFTTKPLVAMRPSAWAAPPNDPFASPKKPRRRIGNRFQQDSMSVSSGASSADYVEQPPMPAFVPAPMRAPVPVSMRVPAPAPAASIEDLTALIDLSDPIVEEKAAPVAEQKLIPRNELYEELQMKLNNVEGAPTDLEALNRAEAFFMWLTFPNLDLDLNQLNSTIHHLKEMAKKYAMPVTFLEAPMRVAVPAPAPMRVAVPAPAPMRVPVPAPMLVLAPAPMRVLAPAPMRIAVPAPMLVPAPAPMRVPVPAPMLVPAPAPVRVPAPAPVQTAAPVEDLTTLIDLSDPIVEEKAAPVVEQKLIPRNELDAKLQSMMDNVEGAPTDPEALKRAEAFYMWLTLPNLGLDHNQVNSSIHHLREMAKKYAMPVTFLVEKSC